jgi:hypothetical protein
MIAIVSDQRLVRASLGSDEHLEATRQALPGAVLATDQRVHGVHAGKSRQRLERGPLGNRAAHRIGDRRVRVAPDLHAGGDILSHPNHYGQFHAEALLTGAVSALFSLVASYLIQHHGWRLRSAWARRTP